MSPEIRAVVRFRWWMKLSNPEASHKINSTYGSGIIELRVIWKWTHRFEEGEHGLEDEPKPSRPRSNEHVDAIYTLLADNPYIWQNRLLVFWAFTKVQSKVFCLNISCFWKSISSGFLICWMTIKSSKGFDSQQSSWRSSSQNCNIRLRMHISRTKCGFIKKIRDRKYRRAWIWRRQLVFDRWSERKR
jgi:hypothetical protein